MVEINPIRAAADSCGLNVHNTMDYIIKEGSIIIIISVCYYIGVISMVASCNFSSSNKLDYNIKQRLCIHSLIYSYFFIPKDEGDDEDK